MGDGGSTSINYLTHIPSSSIEVIPNCIACVIDTVIVKQKTWALCSQFVPDPLEHLTIIASQFHYTDTLTVRFKTFRCAEENDTLLNSWLYLNKWKFQTNGWSTCKWNASITGNHPFNWPQGGISSNSYSSGANLNQNLFFLPSATSLFVPQNQTFGDSAVMNIDLQGLFSGGYSGQVLNCNTLTASSSCTLKGYVRTVIECATGVRIKDPANDVYIKYLNTSGIYEYKYPVYHHTTVNDTLCESGKYYFYFDLSEPNSYNFFWKGVMDFQLQACCGAGPAGYSVSFYLLPDPSGSCDSLIFNDTTHTQFPQCIGTGCAWIPLSSVGGMINPLCPGCLSPGIAVSKYSLERMSFGLQDTDNDGRADTGLNPIIPGTTWYNNYKHALKPKHSSFGDRLHDKLVAHFQEGDPTSGGYNYGQMLNQGARLNFLQVARTIPSGLDPMKLTPLSLTLYIDEPNTTNPNCINCDDFGIDSLAYRTQHIIYVEGDTIENFLDTYISANRFLFSFETRDSSGILVGNLHNPDFILYTDSVNVFDGFYENQKYRMRVEYDVCGNFMIAQAAGYNTNNVKVLSNIVNNMWLSGNKQPHNAYGTIPSQPNDTIDLHTDSLTVYPSEDPPFNLIDSTFANNYIFFCAAHEGVHYFFSQDGRNASSFTNADSCSKKITINAVNRIAGAITNFNIYPHEYRPPAIWSQEYEVTVPAGYQVSYARTQTEFPGGASNWVSFIPPATSGTFIFHDSILPPLVCLDESVSFTGNLNQYAGSRQSSRKIELILSADSCNVDPFSATDSSVVISFNKESIVCITDGACELDSSFTRKMNSGSSVLAIMPNLITQVAPVTINATHNQVCTSVYIQNPSTNFTDSIFGNISSTAAGYIFIAIPDSQMVPYLSNWTYTYASNDSTIYPVGGQILQITPSLAVTPTFLTGQLCASYDICMDTAEVNLYVGWNCDGFPVAPFDTSSVCGSTPFTFTIHDAQVGMQPSSKSHPDTINNCEPFQISAQFLSNYDGSVYPYQVNLDPLPPGLDILSVEILNCSTSTLSATLIPGTVPGTYNISGSDLITIGFADSALSFPECMEVVVSLLPGCNYSSYVLPCIFLQSLSFCNDSIETIALFTDTLANDTSYCTDCFTLTKTANPAQSWPDSIVTFEIEVCNYNVTGDTVSLIDQLPAGFNVITNQLPPGAFYLLPDSCRIYQVTGSFGDLPCTNHLNTAVLYFDGSNDSLSAYASVAINDTCMAYADSGYVFTDTTYASQLPYNIIYGKQVYICGVFIVDTTFYFLTSNVMMGSGAQIIVNTFDSLHISETTISGCTNMWQRINLNQAAYVNINNSTISDAEYGVYAEQKSTFIIYDADILECVTGVYAPPYNISGFTTTTGRIENTNFEGQYKMKPPYPGQTPYGNIPRAGIDVSHVILNIGNNASGTNTFKNMTMGIVGRNSRLTVRNCELTDIKKDQGYIVYDYSGAAIISLAKKVPYGYLSVSLPAGATSASMFIERADRGIYTMGSSADINNIQIKEVVTGIHIIRCNFDMYSNIRNNKIEASRYGVFMNNNTGSSSMYVFNNNIAVKGKATGIYAGELSKTAPAAYNISYNIIKADTADAGIALHNINRPLVKENNIKLVPRNNNSGQTTGIYVGGCLHSLVSCNDIAAQFNPNASITNKTVGIFSGESDTSQVTCNTIDSTYQGVRFHGWNPATALRGTNFYYHFEGLYLDNSAVIDKQIHHGNRWHLVAAQGGHGAVNMDTTSLQSLDSSLFIILPSQLNTVYEPSRPGFNNTWFDIASGSTFDCNGQIATPTGTSSPVCVTYDTEYVYEGSFDLKLAIATEMLETVDWNEENQAKARQYLYDLLMQDTVLANSNSAFIDFIAEYEGWLQAVYEVSDELRNIEQYDSLFTALIRDTDSLIQFYSDSITVIFDEGREEELSQTIEDFYYQINFLEQTKNNLISQRQAFVEGELGEIQNDYIVSPEIPAVNTQFVNQVYMDYLDSGENDDIIIGNYNSLLGVANQCPAAGGQSVYRARAMLASVNDSLEYSDAIVCLQSGIYREYNSELMPPKFKLVPNPAQNLVELIVEKNNSAICSVEVINILGEELIRKNIDCNQMSHYIDVSMLNNGIYLVKFLINDEAVDAQKLVIMR